MTRKEIVADDSAVWTEQIEIVRGRVYERRKNRQGGDRRSSAQSAHSIGHTTAEEVGREFGELALALEKILRPAAEARMLAGERVYPDQNSGQGRVDREIAKAANLSHDTIHKVRELAGKADPLQVFAKGPLTRCGVASRRWSSSGPTTCRPRRSCRSWWR